MVILQIIVGFMMGVYLMEIVNGHLVTKKILTTLKKNEQPQERGKDNSYTNS